MQLYCGIDFHSNNSVVSIIDETDRVIKEKRLNNNLNSILETAVEIVARATKMLKMRPF